MGKGVLRESADHGFPAIFQLAGTVFTGQPSPGKIRTVCLGVPVAITTF